MSEIVLFIDELRSSSSAVSICRICHEEEFESCKSLETPCACSGTVKFAHRDCVQRWCNEKGNTICEICLQFTALLLMRHLFAVVTGGAGAYPFSLLTVLIAKASGILVPMYILVWILAALKSNIRHHYQNADTESTSDEDEDENEERHSNMETQV